MSKKNRIHKKGDMEKGLDKMIRCPVCGAMSYPLQYSDPQNEVEENAVICGACKVDLWPIMKAIEAMNEEKSSQELTETEENPSELNNTN